MLLKYHTCFQIETGERPDLKQRISWPPHLMLPFSCQSYQHRWVYKPFYQNSGRGCVRRYSTPSTSGCSCNSGNTAKQNMFISQFENQISQNFKGYCKDKIDDDSKRRCLTAIQYEQRISNNYLYYALRVWGSAPIMSVTAASQLHVQHKNRQPSTIQ